MRRKPLILCVGDSSSVLKGRQMLLEEDGYRVLTATSGKDALQVFASNPVDLVLFDQAFDVTDEVLQKLDEQMPALTVNFVAATPPPSPIEPAPSSAALRLS